MGANIRNAFHHLAASPPVVPARPRGHLWAELLGPFAEEIESMVAEAQTASNASDIALIPFALFADQDKAFERVPVTWFKTMLAGWRLPRWLHNAALALVLRRVTKASLGGEGAEWLDVACGFGMGSPAAPLFWAMIYDPVPEAIRNTLGRDAPTYVDDLAALGWGPADCLAIAWLLMFATKATGLRLSAHSCDVLQVDFISEIGWTLITRLPVYPELKNGTWRLPGLPSGITLRLLSAAAGSA